MQATTLEQDLVALERQFWNGDAAFYRKHLDEKCLTVFEEMAGVFNKDDVAQQAGEGNRWQIQQVQPKGFIQPTDDTAIVSCEVYAKRKTGEPYHALTSSGYIRRHGEWKMTFHQQTPLESANHVSKEKSAPGQDATGDRLTKATSKRGTSVSRERLQGDSRPPKRMPRASRSAYACGLWPLTVPMLLELHP